MKKVQTLVEINGQWLPTIIEKEDETENFEIPYEEKVVSLIREKYTVNDELAILRKRETNSEEFNEYYNYVEECKERISKI